jgi:hypothetical protein
MQPPFTAEQFFDVFGRYNEGVWPAQVVLNGIGLCAAAAAWRATVQRSWTWVRITMMLLAALWLWSGLVYFKIYFVTVTPAGEVFGSFFVAQAVVLLLAAWPDDRLERPSGISAVAGASILIYALLLYPIAGLAAGQRYPAFPTFGAPCPVTLFTFGVVCLFATGISRAVIAIPVLWVLISSYAAIGFHVLEDFGLPVAALATVAVLYRERHRPAVAAVAV